MNTSHSSVRSQPVTPAGRTALARRLPFAFSTLVAAVSIALLAGCNSGGGESGGAPPAVDDIAVGQDVFRFETFGNERFWTDAMRLPQGIAGAGITPLDALGLGLNVNVQALSDGTAAALLDALDQISNGADPADTVLAEPAVTLALINEGAVNGLVVFDAEGARKPLGSDSGFDPADSLDLARGERVGLSCAVCHSRTDDSVVPAGFAGPGSVGVQVDGIVAEGLDVGTILAVADNPRAYLPFLQLAFESLEGATIGNGDFPGLKRDAGDSEARAYMTGSDPGTGRRYYPLTSFDATPDGIGNATYIPPFFRTDLAAPWGHSGAFERLDDFNNLVYTVALDPTSLLTDSGRAFLNVLAGAVGDEIAERYEETLRATGVIPAGVATSDVVPFVDTARDDLSPGSAEGPVGRRVDETRLQALNAYTDQLPAPPAPPGLDPAQVVLGEQIFLGSRSDGGANCVSCHSADPNAPVRDVIVGIASMYRPYDPTVLFERSVFSPPLSDVQVNLTSGPHPSYDNSLVVLDASVRGEVRGLAKPLLLGLDSKNRFLHDGSVAGVDTSEALDRLLDPARGPDAPHPFYFPGTGQSVGDPVAGRAALVDYLRSRSAQ